jgi:CBS domain-containing protein
VKRSIPEMGKPLVTNDSSYIRDIIGIKGADVAHVTPETPVASAAKLLSEKRIGILAISQPNGKVVGLISERDIIRAVGTKDGDLSGVTVADLMANTIISCRPLDRPSDVLKLMQDQNICHMLVYDGHQVEGIVSIVDILNLLLERTNLDLDAATLGSLDSWL